MTITLHIFGVIAYKMNACLLVFCSRKSGKAARSATTAEHTQSRPCSLRSSHTHKSRGSVAHGPKYREKHRKASYSRCTVMRERTSGLEKSLPLPGQNIRQVYLINEFFSILPFWATSRPRKYPSWTTTCSTVPDTASCAEGSPRANSDHDTHTVGSFLFLFFARDSFSWRFRCV